MTVRDRLAQLEPFVKAYRRVGSIAFAASQLPRRRQTIEAYLRTHDFRGLQLGTGANAIPGWLNTDTYDEARDGSVVYLDACRRFPLPDASFDAVFSEHLIEHLTYRQGLRCLSECRRVLRPGGRIRVATPALDRVLALYTDASGVERRYVEWATARHVRVADGALPGFVVNDLMRNWGHRFLYDAETLGRALKRTGFVDLRELAPGESHDPKLRFLEGHDTVIPAEFNALETLVLEARRPSP
jgi:predicted SAM-dependent methyltransferase